MILFNKIFDQQNNRSDITKDILTTHMAQFILLHELYTNHISEEAGANIHILHGMNTFNNEMLGRMI